MAITLGSRAAAEESALQGLLRHSVQIGGIFDFGYREASVLTNDAWLQRAHGVPQHCLLLAYPRGLDDPEQAAQIAPADREIVLLRVLRETSLPNQDELVRLRAEDSDRTITNHYRNNSDPRSETDVLTRKLMQQCALRCRILGTFVEDDAGNLVFGKDVDAIYAAAGYVVCKPYGNSLQKIVEHVELPMGERDEPNSDLPDTSATMVIGRLRYASSRHRERIASTNAMTTEVDVPVRPKDFVAHKTAVFGMTRAGKSNTMKVLAATVHLYAHKTGTRVGQLIFDPAGEYAYANRQDGTALAQLGDNVRIYRLGATEADRSRNIRPLSLNFFDANQIDGCWSLIETYLAGEDKRYVANFLAADPTRSPDDVEDQGDKRRLEAVRAMYFAILAKALVDVPREWTCKLPVNRELRSLLSEHEISGRSDKRGLYLYLDRDNLIKACEIIARHAIKANKDKDESTAEAVKLWFSDQSKGGHGDPAVDGLVGMLAPTASAAGWKILRPLRAYHSPESHTDFAKAIYADLARGRLVIVDLSRGSEQVLQTCAERVVREIVSRASQRFREGKPPRPMQIFLEEAHRLLHRDKFNKATEKSDPYVILAKEAAKYKIGMVYATQEVSSVDEVILSNTANWICAFMNNSAETAKLAKYYDFADFADQILTADDRGFVRLRTASSPYTLPVQIAKFDLDMVNSIRKACGLDPVERSTDFSPDAVDIADDDFEDCPDPDDVFMRKNQVSSPTFFGEES